MGEWLTLRSFRAGDGEAIAALGPSLSTQTLHARFWIGTPVIPSSYLDLVRTRWPADWNAVMACRDGRVIGWADCGRNVDGSSDVAVCLVDAEQGRGTGVLLLQAALDLSSNLGIPVARAGIQRSNVHALHAWRRATRLRRGAKRRCDLPRLRGRRAAVVALPRPPGMLGTCLGS